MPPLRKPRPQPPDIAPADPTGPADGAPSRLVTMGRVLAPYGVRGWIKVAPSTEDPEALLAYGGWWLRRPGEGAWHPVTPVGGRQHGAALITGLRDVETREQALALKGAEIGVPRDALPAITEDELYWDDLVGMEVVNREGVALGRVTGIVAHGAHPILTATSEQGEERLIPYVPSVVVSIDREAGALEVDWGVDY